MAGGGAGAARAVRLLLALLVAGGGRAQQQQPPRYSSRIVHTSNGAIRGVIVSPSAAAGMRRLEPVEAFLGVPYGGRPPRLGAPPPPPRWSGTRLADAFAPACPQRPPDIANRSVALATMPLGLYHEVAATAALLANQSEDCLHLNLWVPGSGAQGEGAPYPVVAWLGAPAHEWGAAAALDGAVLAARAQLVVVTLDHRLGLLGWLTTGAGDAASAVGGAALLDVAAALRWLRRNVRAFGGDPRRVTLAGRGGGAATANALLATPLAKGLVWRALLISGCALSPWALAPAAALARQHAAQQLRCSRDANTSGDEHWLVACVRSMPLEALVAVDAPRARFLAGWAPALSGVSRALHASDAFLNATVALVLSTTESYHFFGEDDIRNGFEEEQRNRVLRTYVRNVYRWHRNEILAAARNEYTDWERPIQHPINIRDATLEALSDAAAAAPALKLAQLHARRGAHTLLAHFAHQTKDADYPQRLGSVTGEALPYFLGLPLLEAVADGRATGAWGRNYSRGDAAVADACVALLGDFARGTEHQPAAGGTAWPRYDLASQQYLTIGSKVRVRSHYRGHKLALWLHLVPQLHRPGAAAASQHHQFPYTQPDMFDGEIFPDLPSTAETALAAAEDGVSDADESDAADADGPDGAEPAPSAECASAAPADSSPSAPPAAHPLPALDHHYYSYSVWLGAVVMSGCVLLALNALLLAAVYLSRARRTQQRARPRPHAGRPRHEGIQTTLSEACEPRRTSLKRSSDSEPRSRPELATPHKKRVTISEISV